jgi:hypothetical protein
MSASSITENSVHRGTDFVRHGREKHTLSPVGGFSPRRRILKPTLALLKFADQGLAARNPSLNGDGRAEQETKQRSPPEDGDQSTLASPGSRLLGIPG